MERRSADSFTGCQLPPQPPARLSRDAVGRKRLGRERPALAL